MQFSTKFLHIDFLSNFFCDRFLAVDPRKCYVTGRGVQQNGIRVGDVADFKVHTAGAGDGDLKVTVVGPGGVEERIRIKKVRTSSHFSQKDAACHPLAGLCFS